MWLQQLFLESKGHCYCLPRELATSHLWALDLKTMQARETM